MENMARRLGIRALPSLLSVSSGLDESTSGLSGLLCVDDSIRKLSSISEASHTSRESSPTPQQTPKKQPAVSRGGKAAGTPGKGGAKPTTTPGTKSPKAAITLSSADGKATASSGGAKSKVAFALTNSTGRTPKSSPLRRRNTNSPMEKRRNSNSPVVQRKRRNSSSPLQRRRGGDDSWRLKSLIFRNTISKSIDDLDSNESSPTIKGASKGKTFSESIVKEYTGMDIFDFSDASSLSDVNSDTMDADFEYKNIYSKILDSIRNDDCKNFKALLKKNAIDVNMILGESGSLIHESAYRGCTKCVKALLKLGSYVNMGDDAGWTPLHAAVLGCNLDAVKLLLDNHALPNQVNDDGLSPCHLAVCADNLHIIHELMTHGGDPLLEGVERTPFQMAIDLKRSVALNYFVHMPCFLVNHEKAS